MNHIHSKNNWQKNEIFEDKGYILTTEYHLTQKALYRSPQKEIDA